MLLSLMSKWVKLGERKRKHTLGFHCFVPQNLQNFTSLRSHLVTLSGPSSWCHPANSHSCPPSPWAWWLLGGWGSRIACQAQKVRHRDGILSNQFYRWWGEGKRARKNVKEQKPAERVRTGNGLSPILPHFLSFERSFSTFPLPKPGKDLKHPERFYISCRRTILSLQKTDTCVWSSISKGRTVFQMNFRRTLHNAPALPLNL